jgi:hypothetical protein
MDCTLMTLEVAHVAEVFGVTVGFSTFVGSLVLVHMLSSRLLARAVGHV